MLARAPQASSGKAAASGPTMAGAAGFTSDGKSEPASGNDSAAAGPRSARTADGNTAGAGGSGAAEADNAGGAPSAAATPSTPPAPPPSAEPPASPSPAGGDAGGAPAGSGPTTGSPSFVGSPDAGEATAGAAPNDSARAIAPIPTGNPKQNPAPRVDVVPSASGIDPYVGMGGGLAPTASERTRLVEARKRAIRERIQRLKELEAILEKQADE